MMWKFLAGATLALHVVWIGVVIAGPLWAWKRPRFRLVHAGMLWATLAVELTGAYCPLTLLETTLRVHYDPSKGYSRGFIADWADRLLSWPVDAVVLLTVIVGWALLWTAVYAVLRRREKT